MFKILEAEQLSANVYKQVILAPRVAKSCEPGQFIILRVDENGERIPLTICDYDREAGTVTIVFQPIGVSTNKLLKLKAGDSIADFVGPLGRPSELVTDDFEEVKKKRVVVIAGGVGTAPVYPQAKWLHDHGIECDIIIGARSKDILIMFPKCINNLKREFSSHFKYGIDSLFKRIFHMINPAEIIKDEKDRNEWR